MADITRAYKRLLKAMSPTSFIETRKWQKKISGINLPDKPKLPPPNILWEIITDKPSEIYLRRQQTIKEYKLTSKIFVARLSLLV